MAKLRQKGIIDTYIESEKSIPSLGIRKLLLRDCTVLTYEDFDGKIRKTAYYYVYKHLKGFGSRYGIIDLYIGKEINSHGIKKVLRYDGDRVVFIDVNDNEKTRAANTIYQILTDFRNKVGIKENLKGKVKNN